VGREKSGNRDTPRVSNPPTLGSGAASRTQISSWAVAVLSGVTNTKTAEPQKQWRLMADRVNVKEDEVIVDERLMEGYLIAEFLWIVTPVWTAIVGTLPEELRHEVQATCQIDGRCTVVPRVICLLVLAATEAR
jgi:hypothetical protein